MKKYHLITLTSLVGLLFITDMHSQVSSQNSEAFRERMIDIRNENVRVELADDDVNSRHPYFDFFMDQDEDYLIWLYVTNAVNMLNNQKEDYLAPRKILRHSGGNNTLIFKITKKDEVKYDTLRNSIHPNYVGEGKEKEDGWDVFSIRKSIAKWRGINALDQRNIRGDLPRGCMVYIESSRNRNIKVGVNVASAKADVDIQIINKKNEVVDVLVHDNLLRGWKDYEWIRGANPRGKYTVKITINGQSLLQDIKI